MFFRLALLFVGVPILELYLLVTIGARIGVMTTIGIAIVTGIIGAALAKREGLRTLEDARRMSRSGQMPTNAMIDGLLILIAGAVLLTPGFLTDTAGFLLLIPPVRAAVRNSIKQRLAGQINVYSYAPRPGSNDARPEPGPYYDTRTDPGKPGAKKPVIVVEPKRDESDRDA